MIEKAKKNAKKLGLEDDAIQWNVQPCQEYLASEDPLQGAMVTNPPYGIRMLPDDIADIHTNLFALAEKYDLNGGIVTAYEHADRYCKNPHRRTTMIIKNGAEDTTFWKKKEEK